MAKRKFENVSTDVIEEDIVENIEVSDNEIIEEDIVKSIFSQEKCTIKTINVNTIGFYFKKYGISIETNNHYNIGDEITVNYKSDIGKPDFEYWID